MKLLPKWVVTIELLLADHPVQLSIAKNKFHADAGYFDDVSR